MLLSRRYFATVCVHINPFTRTFKYERSNKRFETFYVTRRSGPLDPKGRCEEAFYQSKVSPAESQASRSSKNGFAENSQTETGS